MVKAPFIKDELIGILDETIVPKIVSIIENLVDDNKIHIDISVDECDYYDVDKLNLFNRTITNNRITTSIEKLVKMKYKDLEIGGVIYTYILVSFINYARLKSLSLKINNKYITRCLDIVLKIIDNISGKTFYKADTLTHFVTYPERYPLSNLHINLTIEMIRMMKKVVVFDESVII